MKRIQCLVLVSIVLALFAGAAEAQKKPGTTAKRPPVTKTIVPPLDVRAAREKVGNQLANINQFVDILGPVAVGIETLDQQSQSKSKRPTRAALDQNNANKQKVIQAIRNLKAGLSDLESDFRTKPLLQRYLTTIQGITDLAAKAEDSALAGRFVAAKEPLRGVASKLTDTLAILPK
jgi:hypothetical protein